VSTDVTQGQQRMFAWIAGFGDQLRAGAGLPALDAVTPPAERPRQILACGMGGSAQAAGLLADGWPGLPAPVLVHRDYGLPSWADTGTLVIASSYSGGTAETLDAVAAARQRGCPVVAITSGGALAQRAADEGFPAVLVPGGQPPRTALGYSMSALLHVLHRSGLLPDPTGDLAAAAAAIEGGGLATTTDGAQAGAVAAEALAADLAGRFTVVFTSGAGAHGAGRRLLAQLQENAKAPGHVAPFPELDHNEIVGWNLTPARRDGFALVVLRGDETDSDALRVDTTLDLLREQFAVTRQFQAAGEGHLTRLVGLIALADLTSAHVAVRTGVDPVPIARIDALKERLAGR
jgi:glucose/mannose-6-phosphate isomerase